MSRIIATVDAVFARLRRGMGRARLLRAFNRLFGQKRDVKEIYTNTGPLFHPRNLVLRVFFLRGKAAEHRATMMQDHRQV